MCEEVGACTLLLLLMWRIGSAVMDGTCINVDSSYFACTWNVSFVCSVQGFFLTIFETVTLNIASLSLITGAWAGEGEAGVGESACRTESSERGTRRWTAVHWGRQVETGSQHAGTARPVWTRSSGEMTRLLIYVVVDVVVYIVLVSLWILVGLSLLWCNRSLSLLIHILSFDTNCSYCH